MLSLNVLVNSTKKDKSSKKLIFEEDRFSVDAVHGEELHVYQLNEEPDKGTFYKVDSKEEIRKELKDYPPMPCSHEAGSHIHLHFLNGETEEITIR